jgi:hypothetical protein
VAGGAAVPHPDMWRGSTRHVNGQMSGHGHGGEDFYILIIFIQYFKNNLT